MPLNDCDRAALQAALDDLRNSKIPIDNPKIESILATILRALLAEPPHAGG